jgi:pantoate--beta-alanine ligase
VKVVRSVVLARRALAEPRKEGQRIGFVPTMGALHDGHMSLVEKARAVSDYVAMSIFVNPLQFGPTEDFGSYPRDEAADRARAEEAGVDLLFLPSVEEIYHAGRSTTVSVGSPLSTVLEGAARPGHFDGVATVVATLFNMLQPTDAFFGQKDAQQVAVIRHMVVDLAFALKLHVCPTVRDPDGLAMSSRNSYLSAEERVQALGLRAALEVGRWVIDSGGDPAQAEADIWRELSASDGVVAEYAAAVDPDSFDKPHVGGPVLLAVAGRVGTTRLIDNILI